MFLLGSGISRADLPGAAGRHDGPGRLIRAEVFGSLDGEKIGKARAGAIDTALDGADRAPADVRGLLVGEAGRADQDQRLALIGGKLRERPTEFLEFESAALLGM